MWRDFGLAPMFFPCHRLAGSSWGFLRIHYLLANASIRQLSRQRHPDSKPDELRQATESRAVARPADEGVCPYVGPDAGVPIKPAFGLMGWRCPRLGGRAIARRLMLDFCGCGLGLKTED